MSRTVVVDAHALLWYLEDHVKLSPLAAEAMNEPGVRLVIPAIVIAEVYWALGKGGKAVTVADFESTIADDARITVAPLDGTLVWSAMKLVGKLEMHDRLIIATTAASLELDPSTVLLTADADIHAAALVPVIW